MRGTVRVGLIVVFGCAGLARCSAPVARAPRERVAPRQKVRVQPPKTRTPSRARVKKPLPATACSALLRHYKHETARIPYPANLPIRALLPIGDKLVQRYRRVDEQTECVAKLRVMLARFFVHAPLPDGVTPPARSTAGR